MIKQSSFRFVCVHFRRYHLESSVGKSDEVAGVVELPVHMFTKE